MHFVIFKADDGTLSALSPAPGWDAATAGRKDVPPLVVQVPTGEVGTDKETGEQYAVQRTETRPRPFLIVEADRWPEEVPEGRTFEEPDGYGIGTEAWLAEQE